MENPIPWTLLQDWHPVKRSSTVCARPMAFLLIAAGTVGASYYVFLQKKTEYYTNRDARLIARAANQVGRSVTIAAGILKNAAQLNEGELRTLYRVDGTVPDEQRMPSKIFKDIKKVTPDPTV